MKDKNKLNLSVRQKREINHRKKVISESLMEIKAIQNFGEADMNRLVEQSAKIVSKSLREVAKPFGKSQYAEMFKRKVIDTVKKIAIEKSPRGRKPSEG